MPRRSLLGAAALLLFLIGGGGAWAGELSKDETRWAKECLKRIGSNSPRVRQGAERGLIELGVDVMPLLVDAWERRDGRAERAGLRRVFEGLGTPRVLSALQRMRADARGRAAKRLDALIGDLREGDTAAPGVVRRVGLTPSSELDWRRVPWGAEHEIGETLPRVFGLGMRRVRRKGTSLVVDVDGDGEPETTVRSSAPEVLALSCGARPCPISIYVKLGTWYAASASLFAGEAEGRRIELLDGDLDGRLDGPGDFVRVEDGAFSPIESPHLLLWGEGLVRYEVEWKDGQVAIRLHPLESPRDLSADVRSGWHALNRFRREVGLAPLRYHAARSKGCREHAAYLGRHGRGGGAHTQDRNAEGYTPAGERAAGQSNVGSGTLSDVVVRIARTLLHRVRWLCDASEPVGLGASSKGKGWSVVWTGPGAASPRGPVLVPAPGATAVPTTIAAENPVPDESPHFYERKRGYPVSATYGTLPFRDVGIRVFESDGATPVPGRLFTRTAPVSARFPRNGNTAFFVPGMALRSGKWYWAVLTARESGRAVTFAWTFRAR